MGARVLLTVQMLSEIAKQKRRGGRRTEKPLETRTVGPKNMIRESGRGVGGGWVTMILMVLRFQSPEV